MTRLRTFAGSALLLGSLSLIGCGDRKGDLGAIRLDHGPPIEFAAETSKNKAELTDDSFGENSFNSAGTNAEKVTIPVHAETVPILAPEVVTAASASAVKNSQSSEMIERNGADKTNVIADIAPLPLIMRPDELMQTGKVNEVALDETRKSDAEKIAVDEAVSQRSMAEPIEVAMAPVKGDEDRPIPTPAPQPAPLNSESMEERAARLLQQSAAVLTVGQQQEIAQADALFRTGMAQYENLEYEAALESFKRAVALDPTNANAHTYLSRTKALLGVHTNRVEQALRSLENHERVKLQKSLVELANSLEEARKLEQEGSQIPLELEEAQRENILAAQLSALKQAQDRYRRVKEIMNWFPPQIDLPRERQVVDEALVRVRQKILDKEEEISFVRRLESTKLAEQARMRETELFKQRIEKLLEQVGDLYYRGEFTAAEKLAQRIMVMDPFNAQAETWKRKARSAYNTSMAEWIRVEAAEGLKSSWESVEASHIPYADLLVYPSNWDQISRRTDRATLGERKVEEAWKDDIRKKLKRKVSFEFADTPLDEAIAFLRSLTPVTMIVDPKVLAGGAIPPINLRVNDMSLDLALEWILRLAELDYSLKDNAIFISRKTNLIEDVELRIYDVADLTQEIPDFPGPEFELYSGDDQAGGGGLAPINPFAAPAGGGAAVTLQSIADMIRNRVMPDSWDPQAGTSIEERGGKLIVMQRPEVHELINKLLSNFRSAQKLMVNIESRFLTIREGYLEDIGVEFHGLDPNVLYGDFGDISSIGGVTGRLIQPRLAGSQDAIPANVPLPGITNGPDRVYSGLFSQVGAIFNHSINFFSQDQDHISNNPVLLEGGLSSQVTVLNNMQVQAFVKALAVRETTTTLVAPRLTVFNTQRAHMFVARQRSYVADYEISGDSYDPIIRQFMVGVVLDVRPTVSSDRRYVTMELRPTVTELTRFFTRQIDSFTINQGANVTLIIPLSFPIQFPELSIRRVRTTAAVPDGGILLIGGLYKNNKFTAENGVPFLSDLPVVGRLFRWNVVDNAKVNLSILVSPRVIMLGDEGEGDTFR